MRFQRQGWRAWTALCAAYLLVLQTSFVGLSLGVHALPGAFADPICSSGEAMAGFGQPADHAHQPKCCLHGCGLSGPSAAAPPDATSALMVPRAVASSFAHASDRVLFSRDRGPPSTRAPPKAGSSRRA